MPQMSAFYASLGVSDGKPSSGRGGHAKSASNLRSIEPDADSDAPTSTTRLLTSLNRLFTPIRRSHTFSADLQHVKGLLYNKEYLAAFGTDSGEGERWREVYVARWTPARAVMYERILQECGIAEALQWAAEPEDEALTEEQELERDRELARRRRQARQDGKAIGGAEELSARPTAAETDVPAVLDVVMIGAGAGSEVLALGSVLGAVAASDDPVEGAAPKRRPRIAVHAVDQGSWATLLSTMEDELRQEWPSLTSDEATGGGFSVNFVKGDILAAPPSPPPSADSPASDAPTPTALNLPFASPSLRLITICFTITELLLQSRVATLRLLSSISLSAPSGTLFLIVESASLALVPLGKEGRTYPLGTLLDHALCGAKGDGAWTVVRSEEAKWYRMPDGAEDVYNAGGKGAIVKLENSRVVLRLYKKK